MNQNIQRICCSLQDLSAPLSEDAIRQLLQELSGHEGELRGNERFDEKSYCRNRIYQNEFVDVLLLCWRSSQRTPIHNHAGSTCGVYVMRGEACEIPFSPSPVGLLIPKAAIELHVGDITISADSDAHLVGNFAGSAHDLVTLHCYSPPLTSMRVFEEKDTFFAQYEEITDAASSSGCYHVEI
jgi:cysteine dioxygenase